MAAAHRRQTSSSRVAWVSQNLNRALIVRNLPTQVLDNPSYSPRDPKFRLPLSHKASGGRSRLGSASKPPRGRSVHIREIGAAAAARLALPRLAQVAARRGAAANAADAAGAKVRVGRGGGGRRQKLPEQLIQLHLVRVPQVRRVLCRITIDYLP